MNVLNILGRPILVLVSFTFLGAAAHAQSRDLTQTPGIGLETGQNAPAFALQDQLGQLQTKESVKGKNGTVLLFVRSADW
jgi:hypothetical protein